MPTAQQPSGLGSVEEDEKLWGFLAWLLSIVGAVLALVLRPGYRYARYWAYLSISFFLIVIAASIVGSVLALVPFIGWAIRGLIFLSLVVAWVVGIIRSLETTWWKPPLIYDIARALGVERI